CRTSWCGNSRLRDTHACLAATKRPSTTRRTGTRTACWRWTSRWRRHAPSPHATASMPSCGSTRRPRRGWCSPRRDPAGTSALLLFRPGGEGAALLRQLTQQLRGLEVPRQATLRVLLEARQHRVQADLVGVEHRAAAPARETVAGGVHHVDVAGTQRHALLQQLGTLVDHREDAALDDLLARDR